MAPRSGAAGGGRVEVVIAHYGDEVVSLRIWLLLFSVGLSSCSGSDIQDPDWRLAAESVDGALICVDRNSLKRGILTNPEAWISERAPNDSDSDENVDETLRLVEFDCQKNTSTERQWIERKSGENRSRQLPTDDQIPREISPDSVYASLANAVCRQDIDKLPACSRNTWQDAPIVEAQTAEWRLDELSGSASADQESHPEKLVAEAVAALRPRVPFRVNKYTTVTSVIANGTEILQQNARHS